MAGVEDQSGQACVHHSEELTQERTHRHVQEMDVNMF